MKKYSLYMQEAGVPDYNSKPGIVVIPAGTMKLKGTCMTS